MIQKEKKQTVVCPYFRYYFMPPPTKKTVLTPLLPQHVLALVSASSKVLAGKVQLDVPLCPSGKLQIAVPEPPPIIDFSCALFSSVPKLEMFFNII